MDEGFTGSKIEKASWGRGAVEIRFKMQEGKE